VNSWMGQRKWHRNADLWTGPGLQAITSLIGGCIQAAVTSDMLTLRLAAALANHHGWVSEGWLSARFTSLQSPSFPETMGLPQPQSLLPLKATCNQHVQSSHSELSESMFAPSNLRPQVTLLCSY
jgi:hypothetical protein